ncbi:hypothetical protein CI109_107037 [Kwoniella shandongensis]|uniref:Protein-lysine N-methyltransferase EFM4 n=1 Tax=Kwoniella shandongensis TaxID=1734106 RepID=A0A5M6BQK6_9TREE|nr:uncharacterized protein CI109_006445 [Kwoniella shandongensis]KAA5525176.1 hypothetical protein CI109_006445 [Kwoniella shandongensis]
MSDDELPPSKLGTKEHWDMVYEREVRVFDDVGDEGEVWFGETAVSKMRKWAQKHLPRSSTPLRVLECGSGNGTLLLSFLTSPAEDSPQPFHLTGIDYCDSAAVLAQSIEKTRRETLEEELDEDEEVLNPCEVEWRVEDLLRKDFGSEEKWDLVMDKGTFDALCLSNENVDDTGRLPSQVYPERMAKLVKEGGWFLITSCNFTEEEIKKRYMKEGLGFKYHSSVPHPSFAFGGKTGTTVCTVAFQKLPESSSSAPESGSIPNGYGKAVTNGNGKKDDMFVCIDGGGTKTDVAIASSSRGVIARASGGTGNMAEVGLEIAYETIVNTVREAISALPAEYQISSPQAISSTCPLWFGDIWVGISGCDTALDQKRMSDRLAPFFGRQSVPILNDAHLLGGGLLTHHCPWGIAVIAGTGSVVVALEVTESGEVVQLGRRGGLGYLLGDEGSAYDLGRCAIRNAVDDYDAREEVKDGLAKTIRDHFEVEETGEVIGKVYDLDTTLSVTDAMNERKLKVAALSRPILEAFTQTPPDPIAVRAVDDATGGLARSIAPLVKQLTKPGNERKMEQAGLVMGGGVIRQPAYREVLMKQLKDMGVEFGKMEVLSDVAGEGVLGLVEKAKGRVQST